jgi:hypothetical protein
MVPLGSARRVIGSPPTHDQRSGSGNLVSNFFVHNGVALWPRKGYGPSAGPSRSPVNQHSRRAALEPSDSDSLFPPEEAGSFCARPTPVVPASEELRVLGTRSRPPDSHDGLLRPSARPTASFGPAADLAHEFYESPPQHHASSLAPPIAPRAHRSRGREIAAKLLFVTLFAAVATLLGFAVKKKLDTAWRVSGTTELFAGTR